MKDNRQELANQLADELIGEAVPAQRGTTTNRWQTEPDQFCIVTDTKD